MLVASWTSSTKQAELFGRIQEELIKEARVSKTDLPFKKVYRLINEVDTRWNSTYNMLNRFLLLRKAIEKAFGAMVVLKVLNYTIDWKLVEKLICYLKPSYELTVRLSGQSYSSIPLVSSLLPILMKHTIDYFEDEDLSEAAIAYYSKLEEYSYSIKNDLAITSTCLDPRVKMSFIADNLRNGIVTNIRESLAKICPDDLNCSETDRSDSSQILADTSIFDQAYISSGEDEVRRYFDTPREIKERNVIDFWRGASTTYPKMQKLARILLCVQATSVPSERAFSFAGLMDHPRKANLSDDSFRASILLNSWFDLLNEGQ